MHYLMPSAPMVALVPLLLALGLPPLSLVLGSLLEAPTPSSPQAAPPWLRRWRPHASGRALLTGLDAVGHRVILGVTGAGKSAFIASLVVQLINQGIACLVIDSHDLCERILRLLWALGFYRDPRGYERVVWVPFGRPGASPSYNVHDQPYEPHVVARNVFLGLERAWPALAGGNAPVVENLVLAGCYVLACHRLPITTLSRLLTDAPFRDALLATIPDAEVVRFFRRFDASARHAAVLSESTLRRAFLLSFAPALRYSLGQATNRLQLGKRLNQGMSVLLDLSGMDEESTSLIGCLLAAEFEIAALSRADTPAAAATLPPIHAFIDEAPVFMSQSATALDHLLAQSRKQGVTITLAAQFLGQARKLQAALQNAQLIAFRLGLDDAAWAAPRLFTPDPYRLKERRDMRTVYMSESEQRTQFEQHLTTLPPRIAFLRTGERTIKFQTVLLPPAMTDDAAVEQVELIKARYAHRLLTPHTQIDAARPAHQLAGQGGDTQSAPAAAASPQPPPPRQDGVSAMPPRHRRMTPLVSRDEAPPHPDET